MPLKFLYITNNETIAVTAEECGVDFVVVDLEVIGKEERQRFRNTVISYHTMEDVRRIRRVLTHAKLLVRLNPIHEGSREEVDQAIEAGADILMLPYFKTQDEVRDFLGYVRGRVGTCLLWETVEAVDNMEDILTLDGIDMIHIGLNDLHIGCNMKFMFELLADGTVEMLCNRFKAQGIPYGFGGIARIGQGDLPAEYIIAEHYRLGSSMTILSRSFFGIHAIENIAECKGQFKQGIQEIRRFEESLAGKDEAYFEANRRKVQEKVAAILRKIEAKAKELS